MDTTVQPKMKPVLVQRVSDEIRDLRKGDVDLQSTVLSARAVADIFRGDTVDKTNGRDSEYYSGSDVDLNLIIDSGCRHIAEGSYINGPKYAVREEENGDQTPLSGYLYTMGMLPSGHLYWGPQEFPKTREDIEIAIQNADVNGECYRIAPDNSHDINQPPIGAPIRQLFYVHSDELDEPTAYTRIGRFESYTTPAGDLAYRYEWGEWVTLNGETQYIVVTDARMEEVVNPIVNAVYSIHTNVPMFYLPEADEQKYGSTIRLIQHADPNVDDRSLWATNVVYQHGDEGDADYEKMQITCTPAPRRNTVKTEDAYKEGLVPTEYIFEVAPRMDDANGDPTLIGKTWHLKVDADETEFTTGIVELLDAHTELGIADIIDYANRKYSQDNGAYASSAMQPLYINRAVLVDGFLKLNITKASEFTDNDWSLQIKRLDSRNPINFVPTKDVGPVEGKVYFIKKPYSAAEGVFSIAVLPGGQFNCTTVYYEINADADIQDLFTVSSAGLTAGIPVTYQHKIYRNDIIYVVINPSATNHGLNVSGHIFARTRLFPVLSFVPDPHPGSYVSREELNRDAFTGDLFQALIDAGQLPAGSIARDCPASTQALIAGYTYLAKKLQEKGLLFGPTDCTEVTPDPNELFESGMYWITGITEPHPHYPQWVSSTEGARLIVLGNEYGPKGLVHENGQYFLTADASPVEGKQYYIRDFVTGGMVSAGTIVDFNIGIKYYEKDPGLSLKNDADVTQLLFQTGAAVSIWMRTYKQASETWTEWACLTGGPYSKSYMGNARDDVRLTITANQIKSWMQSRDLTLFCGVEDYSSTLTQLQQINLPAPDEIEFGKKLTLAINAAPYSRVRMSYVYVDPSTGVSTTKAYIYTAPGESTRNFIDIIELISDGRFWYYRTDGGKYNRIGG